jgi:hypothetical protein
MNCGQAIEKMIVNLEEVVQITPRKILASVAIAVLRDRDRRFDMFKIINI